MIVWLELFGQGRDGNPYGVERMANSFATVSDAIAKGTAMARDSTFSFGKAVGYRLYDENNKLIHTGSFEPQRTLRPGGA
jgi:hypothetical protein